VKRGTSRGWPAALFVAGVLLGSVLGPASAIASTGSGDAPAEVDRVVSDQRITESSGLATSALVSGVIWTNNDSGNPPVLFALSRNGSVRTELAVQDVPNVDWEAIGSTRTASGAPALAIADIGDNTASRSEIEVDIVLEPKRHGAVTAKPLRRIRLRYPDGAQDAETLLVDPRSQRLYIVTKNFLGSTVYAVPSSAWPGPEQGHRSISATLVRVSQVPIMLATDGLILPDGRVLIRSYTSLYLLPDLTSPTVLQSSAITTLESLNLPEQKQGEGLALADAGSRQVLLSSEGVGQQLLRLTIPASVWGFGVTAAESSRATAGAGPQPPTRGGPAGGSSTAGGRTSGAAGPGGLTWMGIGSGVVVLSGLLLLVLGASRLRR
jgi:hypothetical protein